MSQSYTIARLARVAGVHIETIRYYQRRGLVPEPPRPTGSVRRYTEADAERLRFIKRAQAMGFTLAEISDLLKLRSRRSCRATRNLVATKLQIVDERIDELCQRREDAANIRTVRDAIDYVTHALAIPSHRPSLD